MDISSKKYRRWVLFTICLSSSLVPFMGSSINLALPHIARDLGLHSVAQSWTLTAYLLSSAILQVPFGRLADLWGKRKIFTIGLCIFTVATLCCGFAFNGTLLVTLRVIQGIGSAMVFSTSIAILSSVFPPNERGMAMGINAATVYLSAAAGPSLGGFITQLLGWHHIFTITAGIALLAVVLVLTMVKEQEVDQKGEPFDGRGAVMYGISIFALIYGFTILPTLPGFLLIGIGTLLLVIFIQYERKQAYPVFNVKLLFSNKTFRLSSLAALINYAATYPIGFLLSLYLQEVRGFDARYAGLILIVQPVVQAVLSPLAGKLSDTVSSRYLASGGMMLITLVLLAMSFLITPSTSMVAVLVMLGLLGVGFAAFSSPNTNAIMGSVERKYYSMASATTGTVRLTGQAFSMGITTMVIAIVLKKQMISPAVSVQLMQVIHITFLIFTFICAIGVYASMSRGTAKLVDVVEDVKP